ncbi:MAG: NAD-dependent epimerase/dehydratase family protein [Gammaproteobacteria bacterium]|nr:NAD-dependent epimerase/dehydratase family protein [Gammaproteobacteria bacterium]
MSKFLVTGGCGFIGSHLVDSLIDDGHHVRVLDNLSTGKLENIPTQSEMIVGDITDTEMVRKCMKDMDGCFHLAAIASVQESNENWVGTHQTNLTGTINVFDACRSNKTPVVYASSVAVYGDNAEMPLKEYSILRPLTAYGADKLGSEYHAQVASLVHGIPTTGMRFFNVYGPRQDPESPYSGVISIFVDRILSHQGLCIYGDGQQARDFIYVADIIRFLRAAMTNISHIPAVFNVCTGESVTINQLARTIMAITGETVNIEHHASRRGDIRISVGDPALAKQVLSVSASASLAKGLRTLIKSLKTDDLINSKLMNTFCNKQSQLKRSRSEPAII